MAATLSYPRTLASSLWVRMSASRTRRSWMTSSGCAGSSSAGGGSSSSSSAGVGSTWTCSRAVTRRPGLSHVPSTT
eukprot:45807-Chlamydomonas_euryale.AAC.2